MPWYQTELLFTDKLPNEKMLTNLRGLCELLDYDMPRLEDFGLLGGWRHPIFELQDLLNVLHIMGYPCKGRWSEVDIWEQTDEEMEEQVRAQPWRTSEKDLTSLEPRRARTLWQFSRRFGPYLPPIPKEARRGRRRRRRRSVRAQP